MAWTSERLGEYLRKLRENAGLSHDRLGERVGKSRQQLIAYEQGKNAPAATFLMSLFAELGVELVPPPARSDEPAAIATELRKLRDEIAGQELRDELRSQHRALVARLDSIESQLRAMAADRASSHE